MKSLTAILTLLLSTLIFGSNLSKIEIPSVFSDNMVLQQKSNVTFWGKAAPGTEIKIKATWGKAASAKAQNDSSWSAKIKTPKAGGPYEVTLKTSDTSIVYKNVLIGDVWICSGQSNMEMPLQGWPPNDTIMYAKSEIPKADYPNIRLFTIPRRISDHPEFTSASEWTACTPKTAAAFSATAFFFGKKLNKDLNIPIGLIYTTWGGTPVEAWTSSKYITQVEEYKSIVEKIAASGNEFKKLNEWLSGFPKIDVSAKEEKDKYKNLSFNDQDCSLASYNDAGWHEMKLPTLWESAELGEFDGVVWFRKKVNIPASWLNKDLVLQLGPIDDMDITFINGKKIGGYEETGFYNFNRVYDVPKEMVTDSVLTIAVRVVDNQGGGGIYGNSDQIKLYPKGSTEKMSLAGMWKYLPVAEYGSQVFYVFGAKNDAFFTRPKLSLRVGPGVPTMLYNGMIAPVVPFGIKGAIWYQGEENVKNASMYDKLFPLMIKNWRADWNEGDFPFYYVQIAPYDYGENSPSQIVREAQLKTLAVPNTGMVVTADIGNVHNIHPTNKKDVGERLALWVLAKDYNKKVVCSGPVYKKMDVKGNKAIISFDYSNGGLVIKDKNGDNTFLIAGKDKVFRKADVKVDGKKLIISNPEIDKPEAVRYNWSNTAEATLFNNSGLPASCFRTDSWEK